MEKQFIGLIYGGVFDILKYFNKRFEEPAEYGVNRMKKKIKFIVVSLRQNCGGAIALHSLCKKLSDLGFDARILYTNVYIYRENKKLYFWLKWIKETLVDFTNAITVRLDKKAIEKDPIRYAGYIDVPVKGCKRKYLPFISKNTVVVYPEIIYGNFLKAENVVRWLLYHNRYYNAEHPDSYDKNDLFFCYREVFNDENLNPEFRKLQTPFYDLDLYKQTNFGKRNGKCYIIRKGKEREDLPKEFDGIIIDDLTEKEKIRVFNECEMCISYDTQTSYSAIASLCGCISIIIPESGKTKEDYLGPVDRSFGVAWGLDEKEIKYAKETREELLNEYMILNEKSVQSAKEFSEICQTYFKIE